MSIFQRLMMIFVAGAATCLLAGLAPVCARADQDDAVLSELSGTLYKGKNTIMPYLILDGSNERCYVQDSPLTTHESGARIHVEEVLRSDFFDSTGMDWTRPDSAAPPPFRKGWVVYLDVIQAQAIVEPVVAPEKVKASNVPSSSGQPPKELQQVLETSQTAMLPSAQIKELLCFVDDQDRAYFFGFVERLEAIRLLETRGIFPSGAPVEFKKAANDCWLVVLDGTHILELWQVGGKWRILCPTPGLLHVGRAKLTEAETCRALASAEMKRVAKEDEAHLERRRARYLAVLDLKQRYHLEEPLMYYSGIPTDDPATLSAMSPEDFRRSVLLKLDAPDGLRFQIQPQAETLIEGEPVRITFQINNVTNRMVRLRYRPAVEVIDFSNAITARGAMIHPKDSGRKPEGPYNASPSYPFEEQWLRIAAGETRRISIDLRDFYDLPAAQYSISSHLVVSGDEGEDSWSGVARSDTIKFQVKARTKPRDEE